MFEDMWFIYVVLHSLIAKLESHDWISEMNCIEKCIISHLNYQYFVVTSGEIWYKIGFTTM